MNMLFNMSHIIDHDISTHRIVRTLGMERNSFPFQLSTILESGYLKVEALIGK